MILDDPDLIAAFVVESNEHLSDIENQLIQIEANGAELDLELVNTVFRAVHSIKGAAGFFGLDNIQSLSHSLEHVLNQIRNAELVPTGPIVEIMLQSADRLQFLLDDAIGSNDIDVTNLIAALDAIATGVDLAEPDLATGDNSVPPPTNPQQDMPNAPPSRTTAGREPLTSTPDASIRVPVSTLDLLMNLAGELVLSRNQLLQFVSADQDAELEAVSAGLDQITNNLQEAVMRTRMQPIGSVFGKFPRIVRDLSGKLEKQCELVIEGLDVEVDKSIIEAIADPLTHLVRNCVDHGIEPPALREQRQKAPEGVIRLAARHQAGKVCIEIQDDGGGIDPQVLRKKAVEKKITTAEVAAEMCDAEALRLIFHPGFSTAAQVSDVSGRGVGMDVVRTNIEKLGGTVDVESDLQIGTNIHITLPLTLAIIPSLIVVCRGQRFAVPQVNILELVRISAHDYHRRITTVQQAEVLRLRGELLPLVRTDAALDGLLNRPQVDSVERQAKSTSIVVVETGQSQYGLVVDELCDSEEIVVKPLGQHLQGCQALAGATILGDGQIALILDVAGIAATAHLNSNAPALQADPDRDKAALPAHDSEQLLLFTNHPSEQFAIPMGQVARIERVQASRIESVGGRLVMQYRDGTLTLLALENEVAALPRADVPHVHVVVIEIRGQEYGVIAPVIQDIAYTSTTVDLETLRERGIAGSLVVEGKTTRILDPFQILAARPDDSLGKSNLSPPATVAQPRVLLAEDSAFFRSQVARILNEAGYQVVTAVDGMAAWELVSSGGQSIDLIITDIEMPRMNGFELCRKLRSHHTLHELPIIALTSLASEADLQQGDRCGFDGYQVKMDRDQLIEAVGALLARGPRRPADPVQVPDVTQAPQPAQGVQI